MGKDRFTVVPAVFLLLTRGDEVLLQRRYNTGWADGQYTLPSGHVDQGEFPKEATARESDEESGVGVDPNKLAFLQALYREKPDVTYADYFFQTDSWEGAPRIMEPEKCDDMGWYSMHVLPDNLLSFVEHVIVNFRDGILEPFRQIRYDDEYADSK